jgi:hypothetical protein
MSANFQSGLTIWPKKSEKSKWEFGVVPQHSDVKNLDCQTALSAIIGAKGILLRCKTGTADSNDYGQAPKPALVEIARGGARRKRQPSAHTDI